MYRSVVAGVVLAVLAGVGLLVFAPGATNADYQDNTSFPISITVQMSRLPATSSVPIATPSVRRPSSPKKTPEPQLTQSPVVTELPSTQEPIATSIAPSLVVPKEEEGEARETTAP